MNEYPNNNDYAQGSQAAMGFVLGAVCGAALALLFAPAAGNETRRRLGETARKLKTDMGQHLDTAREKMGDIRNDVKSAVDSGREAFNRSRESRPDNMRTQDTMSRNP